MLNTKRLLLVILLFVGCGPSVAQSSVDPELAPYLRKFEQDIGFSADGIDVSFGNTKDNSKDNTIGYCSHSASGRKIVINPEFWASATPVQREQLMYHELGHCALGLHHTSALAANNCPASIMYPYAFQYCYQQFPEYYQRELKNRAILQQ